MSQPVVALLLTIGLEWLVYLLAFRKEPGKLLLYSVLINASTEPLALFTYQNLLPNFWLVEAAVVMVESVIIALLFRLPYRRAFLLALLANAFSAFAGVLLFFQ
jgi:hypothetical protein